jgi:hypothetical protein
MGGPENETEVMVQDPHKYAEFSLAQCDGESGNLVD